MRFRVVVDRLSARRGEVAAGFRPVPVRDHVVRLFFDGDRDERPDAREYSRQLSAILGLVAMSESVRLYWGANWKQAATRVAELGIEWRRCGKGILTRPGRSDLQRMLEGVCDLGTDPLVVLVGTETVEQWPTEDPSGGLLIEVLATIEWYDDTATFEFQRGEGYEDCEQVKHALRVLGLES